MDPKIEFSFEGIRYAVGVRACELNYIVLPSHAVLYVTEWLKGNPPQPKDLFEVSHVYWYLKPDEIAIKMNGIVAQRL